MGNAHFHPCSPALLGLDIPLLFFSLLTLLLLEQEAGGEEDQ